MKIEDLSDVELLRRLDRVDFAITAFKVLKDNPKSVTAEDLLLFAGDMREGIFTLAELGGLYYGSALNQLKVLCNKLEEEANKRGILDE